MNDLEQYLNKATRGLLGKRKLEVREELESDITERSKKFVLNGFSRDQAISKAILELGDARAVNHGMKGIYVMPTMLKTALAAIMVTLTITAMTKPANAVKLLPPLEVLCVTPSGVQYSFELYPTKNWKQPNNAAMIKAFKPVITNWAKSGNYLAKLEKHIGATVRTAFNNFGVKAAISKRPSQLQCRRYKFGMLEDLKQIRQNLKDFAPFNFKIIKPPR